MATYKDLQRLTGLSLSTISKHYNGLPVRPENAVAIEAAAARLDFRVNGFARGLRSRRSRTVGVLLPALDNEFHLSIIAGLERALRGEGIGVLVVRPPECLFISEHAGHQGDVCMRAVRGSCPGRDHRNLLEAVSKRADVRRYCRKPLCASGELREARRRMPHLASCYCTFPSQSRSSSRFVSTPGLAVRSGCSWSSGYPVGMPVVLLTIHE